MRVEKHEFVVGDGLHTTHSDSWQLQQSVQLQKTQMWQCCNSFLLYFHIGES